MSFWNSVTSMAKRPATIAMATGPVGWIGYGTYKSVNAAKDGNYKEAALRSMFSMPTTAMDAFKGGNSFL